MVPEIMFIMVRVSIATCLPEDDCLHISPIYDSFTYFLFL